MSVALTERKISLGLFGTVVIIAYFVVMIIFVFAAQANFLNTQNPDINFLDSLLSGMPFLVYLGTVGVLLRHIPWLKEVERNTGYSPWLTGFGIATLVSMVAFLIWASTPIYIDTPRDHVRIMRSGEVHTSGTIIPVSRFSVESVTVPLLFREAEHVTTFSTEGGDVRVRFTYVLNLDFDAALTLFQGRAESLGMGKNLNTEQEWLSRQEIAQHEAIFTLGMSDQSLWSFLSPKIEQVLEEVQANPLPTSNEGMLVRLGQLIEEDGANMPMILNEHRPLEISSFEIIRWSTNS